MSQSDFTDWKQVTQQVEKNLSNITQTNTKNIKGKEQKKKRKTMRYKAKKIILKK